MQDRFLRIALIVVLALFAAFVAEPYIARFLYSEDTPRVVTPRGDLAGSEQTAVEIFQSLSPSVVHVFAQPDPRRLADPFSGVPERGGIQSGTGFVWDEAGHVVTNNHVIEGADRIQVVLRDKRSFPAEVVGRDPTTDVAVTIPTRKTA